MKTNLDKNSIVKQRYQSDCGVACLAMATGQSYDRVESCIEYSLQRKGPIKGMSNPEMAIILRKFGITSTQIYTLIEGVPAILSVPSFAPKKFHYVYWDGNLIFDPSNEQQYTRQDFFDAENFPLSDAIVNINDVSSINLPSHLRNDFDWKFITESLRPRS